MSVRGVKFPLVPGQPDAVEPQVTINFRLPFLDDVKVYNRALSQGEVFDIYFEESRNLEGYYPLDADKNDYSGNGRNPTGASGSTTTQAIGWNGKTDDALEFSAATNDNVNINEV